MCTKNKLLSLGFTDDEINNASIDIDTATYSKIENGLFALRKECVPIIEEFYGLEKDSLAKIWLADKVYNVVKDEPAAKEALNAVEKIL